MSAMPAGSTLCKMEAVVIGASAGAGAALSQLLPPLRKEFPLPILIVVHVPADRPSNFPKLLQAKCRITVKEAEDKESIRPGTVYFAPPDYHLLVEKERRLSLSNEEPVQYSRPSIDVLFETAADTYGKALLAIVLTGANQDGARGARAVSEAGGLVMVQIPESAEADMLPKSTLALCPEARAISLQTLSELLRACGGRT